MKHQNKLFFTFILAIGLLMSSCQKEEGEVIEVLPENTLQLDSQLVHLMRMVSMNDGDVDDFIDGNECFSIVFPYEIVVDSISINIESQNDYQLALDIMEETGSNFNDVDFVYPITIMHSDYSEWQINSSQELEANILDCEAINLGIDCLDIIYPITIYMYNSVLEITESYIINNDVELFPFISSLNENDYMSLQFPISVIINNEEVVEVEDTVMFETLIYDCVEQEIDPNTLTDYLVNDIWYVNFFYQDLDYTSNYCEYSINYNEDGTVVATKGNVNINGSWNIGYEGSDIYVELNFENEAPFNELNNIWFVNSYSPDVLGFENPGNSGTIDLLIIDRILRGC